MTTRTATARPLAPAKRATSGGAAVGGAAAGVAAAGGTAAPAGPWAARVPAAASGAAAALRLTPGLMVRPDDAGGLWIRGAELTEALDLALRKLPGAERYTVSFGDDGDVVAPVGKRIPAGTLPDRDWKPIAAWFRPTLPAPALPGRLPPVVRLTLERSAAVAEASVLVTTLDAFKRWAQDAPMVRLKRLQFAASNDGRVVLRGTPLPPVPGVQYVERQGVAVPAGWALCPNLDPTAIHALLLTGEQDLAIFAEDGSWERIDGELFAAATRSAVRATT